MSAAGALRYRRVLLKLSGEALMGEGVFGIDAEVVGSMTKYSQDISAYRGCLVRIDFEIYATEGFLATALDHINFE